jgi:hypothetical protein
MKKIFTGLKDDYDKKIYFGDIVKITADEIPDEEIIIKDKEDVSLLKSEIDGWLSGFGIHHKVVGSIYKNKISKIKKK